MEQLSGVTEMTEYILELHAFLEDDGIRKSLDIKILAPSEREGDHFCVVHAPLLLGEDKKIFGVDPEQASALSVRFVKLLLENKKVLDEDGTPLDLF
jgi:hypothetical protein